LGIALLAGIIAVVALAGGPQQLGVRLGGPRTPGPSLRERLLTWAAIFVMTMAISAKDRGLTIEVLIIGGTSLAIMELLLWLDVRRGRTASMAEGSIAKMIRVTIGVACAIAAMGALVLLFALGHPCS
jgi:hypothetical protein